MRKFTNIKSITNTNKYSKTMSYSSIAPVKYFLTILVLLSLFFFISCSKTEDLVSVPTLNYMSFAISSSGGNPVDTTTKLDRASTYVASIKRESGAPLETEDYNIQATPEGAIKINKTRSSSNLIEFTVNNTGASKVTITATHKKNPDIIEILVLELAPPVDFMSFTLKDSRGTLVDTTRALARASTYVVGVKRGSGAPLETEDYNIQATPVNAITINKTRSSSNLIEFTVNNTSDTSITITATHKSNPGISDTLGLELAPQANFMSFVLTNRSGAVISMTDNPLITTSIPLYPSSTYGLTINRENGAPLLTANYDIAVNPVDAITINETRSSSNVIDFTVNDTSAKSVRITTIHKNNSFIAKTLVLNFASAPVTTAFQQDIEYTVTVPNFTTAASELTREVLEPLNAKAGATLERRYVTENGAGTYDGSSWANAWAATNLRLGLDGIIDATASKVYLLMIAGGTYKPDYSTTPNRGASFIMREHVAIMGGFKTGGGWERTGTTLLSGDIGTVNDNSDNSYSVFYHVNIVGLEDSHLYGVTIENGNANGGAFRGSGGGMYNNLSSPYLTRVIFSKNEAFLYGGGMYNLEAFPLLNQVVFSENGATGGGGMYNNTSSPVLNQVVFSQNEAANEGGGMHNKLSSSPVLNQVVFSENGAKFGGGMYNNSYSSPALDKVVFRGNTAKETGGGMYNTLFSSPLIKNTVFDRNTAGTHGGGMGNFQSSPVIVGIIFTSNSAINGGGMYNNNNGEFGPRILNTIFSGNTTNNGAGAGPDIAMNLGNTGLENITIAGSVLGIGLANPLNGIVGYGVGTTMKIKYHSSSLNKGAVNLGTATLTVNGMDFTYPTITAGSSAINLGLFVRRSGTTYYFSEDNNTWYDRFTTTGGWGNSVTPPANAEDLTAKDIAGAGRNGRPDAGVYELQ